MSRTSLFLIILPFFGDCSRIHTDIRSLMLNSYRQGVADFPDGENVQLTHFSHIGELTTNSGDLIYVADSRSVLTGMPSPRGMNHILFFDQQYHFLGKIRYVDSRPLWCEGSKLHLFGDLDYDSDRTGNVVDFADGFEQMRIYHRSVYGSSGGLYD